MFAHGVDLYIVTDYDHFVLFHHTPATGPDALEMGTIRILKRLSSETSLYQMDSPLALLLGTTLFALRTKGVDIAYHKPQVSPLLDVPWVTFPSPQPPKPPLSPISFLGSPTTATTAIPDHSNPSPSTSRHMSPLELGGVSLNLVWITSEGEEVVVDTTLSRTLYGPFTPSPGTALPSLVVAGGLEWNSLTSGHGGSLLVKENNLVSVGGLWTVSNVDLRLPFSPPYQIINKSSEYYTFKDVLETDWQRTQYTWREAKAAIVHEALLFHNQLAPLQGTVVPRCLGLFGRLHQDDEIWHLLMEDVGCVLRLENMVNPVVQ